MNSLHSKKKKKKKSLGVCMCGPYGLVIISVLISI